MIRFCYKSKKILALTLVVNVLLFTFTSDYGYANPSGAFLRYWNGLKSLVNMTGVTQSGKDISVAVIDSGVYPHKDIVQRLHHDSERKTYRRPHVTDVPNTHGTMVAGVISLIAPNATLMDYDVLTKESTSQDIIAGIKRAADDGAHVINLSLGIFQADAKSVPLCCERLAEAIQYAHEKGAILVACAGNHGKHGYSTTWFPACLKNVIAVGSSIDGQSIGSYSSKGPALHSEVIKPDLVAPGDQVPTLCPPRHLEYLESTGSYTTATGTSLAAPFVSGTIALMKENNPDLSPEEAVTTLCNYATPIRNVTLHPYPANVQGSGLLNVKEAINGKTAVFPHNFRFRGYPYLESELQYELTIRNKGNQPKNYVITTSQENYNKGISIGTPPCVTVDAGKEEKIVVTGKIDKEAYRQECQRVRTDLAGRIYFTCDEEELNIPYTVPVLNVGKPD